MRLKEWLIPQEKIFFTLLERESKIVLDAAGLLHDLVSHYDNVEEKRKQIKDLEHQGDEIVHEIYQKLNKTFITPIDHEDLSDLASRYDEVIDFIYAAANRLYLYEIKEPSPAMKAFSELILKAVTEIDLAFSGMKRINGAEIEKRAIEVHKLENEADDLLNETVAGLFKSHTPLEIIKLKEIYEYLEIITDKCEDVTDVLRDIVLKHT